jgi:hypothetical protein
MLSGLDVRTQHPALADELADRLLEKPIYPTALLGRLAMVRARVSA